MPLLKPPKPGRDARMVEMAGFLLHVGSHDWIAQNPRNVRVEAAKPLEVLPGRFTMSYSYESKANHLRLQGVQWTLPLDEGAAKNPRPFLIHFRK